MSEPRESTEPTASLADYVACLKRGDIAMNASELEPAIAAFTEAAHLRPDMFEAYFKLGCAQINKGSLQEAFDAFQKAHLKQPKDIPVLLKLSELCHQMGDYESSASFLCEILTINDRYMPALCILPELLVKMGLKEDAIELLQSAIPAQPHMPELWTAIGIVMHYNGSLKEAEIFYREALALDPSSVVAKNNLQKITDAEVKVGDVVH